MIKLCLAKFGLLCCILFSTGAHVEKKAPGLIVIQDGISIQEPGIFTKGCFYGKNESASDHAPVLYGVFGTWNIAAAVNQFAIQPNKSKAVFFYNHKFRTNKDGDLINRAGKTIGFIGASEVADGKKSFTPKKIKTLLYKNNTKNIGVLKFLLSKSHRELLALIKNNDMDKKDKLREVEAANKLRVAALGEIADDQEERYTEAIKLLEFIGDDTLVATNQYFVRLNQVVSKIEELFNKNKNLMYIALQEVPDIDEQNQSKENIQALIKARFNKKHEKLRLSISFYDPYSKAVPNKLQSFISTTGYKKDFEPDVAIVSRAGAPILVQESSDNENRFVPWCSSKSKSCFVSVHMPHADSAEELAARCKDINNMATHLHKKGYTKINFAGDFNISAHKISTVCKDILPIADADIELHTSKENGSNSCGTNEGDMPPYNIDLMIKYNFKY